MLKLIPQENPSNSHMEAKRKQRTNIKIDNNNANKKNKKQAISLRFEMNLRKLEKNDHKLFAAASRQLMDYIQKAENITMPELNEMIHNVQRTIISLQKKRIHLIRGEHRKNKNKK